MDLYIVFLEVVDHLFYLRQVSDCFRCLLHYLEGGSFQHLLDHYLGRVLSFCYELIQHFQILSLQLLLFLFSPRLSVFFLVVLEISNDLLD